MANLFGGLFGHKDKSQSVQQQNRNENDLQPAMAFTYITQQPDTNVCSTEGNKPQDTSENEDTT